MQLSDFEPPFYFSPGDYSKILADLQEQDPQLKVLFSAVPNVDYENILKEPYPALVGAIIGQRIKYLTAKEYRKTIYSTLGINFHPIEFLSNISLFSDRIPKEILENIIRVSNFILENFIDLSTNPSKLLECPGVGNWTLTTMILSSTLLKYNLDLFPFEDVFIRNRIQQLYNLESKPNKKQLEEIIKKWSPYRSIVTWHLWRFNI